MRDARSVAARLRTLAGAPTPSTSLNVDRLARSLGCTVEDADLGVADDGIEAVLLPHPKDDRFLIRVDPTPHHGWERTPHSLRKSISRHRRRFRIAHELAHTHFYQRNADKSPHRLGQPGPEEEAFCDELARALLVPLEVAEELPATADSAFTLAVQFDVSLEVATRALAAAHAEAEIALWFWRPGRDPATNLLRQWSSLSDGHSLRPWRSSNVVSSALSGGGTVQGVVPMPTSDGWTGRGGASCHADPERRQVLLVAVRAC